LAPEIAELRRSPNTRRAGAHLTSAHERERRLGALRSLMDEQGHVAWIIGARGDEFMRGRIQYVSDVYLWGGWGFVVLPASGDAVFLADPLAGFMGEDAGWIGEARLTQTPASETRGILSDLGVAEGRVGVVGLSDIVSAAHLAAFAAALPGCELVDATDLFDDVRAIKSAEEISNLEETSAVLRAVFAALAAEIRPGVDERDMLAEAHRLCRQYGCLDGIAMVGRPPAAGFAPGMGGAIGIDDVIVVDLEWGGPSGYWLELRRCFSFGPPPDAIRRYWERRVETFDACVAAMVAGASSDAILTARDTADARYGYTAGDDVRYSAHGIGIDSLEPPWAPGKERTLAEGMVLSLHPNVTLSPAEAARYGAVSVGDSVLVTSTGGRRLTYEREEWVVLER